MRRRSETVIESKEWIEDEKHRTRFKFIREKQARQNVYIFFVRRDGGFKVWTKVICSFKIRENLATA